MSTKRKNRVGGYAMSSDDDEGDPPSPAPPAAKKPKPVAANASSTLTAPNFNHPKATNAPRASVTPRPTLPRLNLAAPPVTATKPTQKHGQKGPVVGIQRTALITPRATPNPPALAPNAGGARAQPGINPFGLSDDESDLTPAPESPVEMRAKGKLRVPEPAPVPGPSQPAVRRAFGRELDELSITVAECMRKEDYEEVIWDLQSKVTKLESTIVELTSKFEAFESQQLHNPASAHSAPSEATSAPIGGEPILTPNLDWDPRVEVSRYVPVSELEVIRILLATYVPREKSARPFVPDTILRKHFRLSCYDCLENVSQASEIKPPVFDALGNHVMFPPELADPSGFVFAYPNFGGSLESNAEYFVRVLQRIRTTIPGDTSDSSVYAHTLTEKVLIGCVITGTWNTCLSEWRKIVGGKTSISADQIRQNVRRKKRIENKALKLAEARKEIPELRHKKYDGLFHPAMLSAEESDGDVIYVKRRSNRSSYVNAIFDASKERTRRRRMSLPGHSYQPKKREIAPIKSNDIPDLKRGAELIKMPEFAFSGKWRKANSSLIDNNAHRIDKTLSEGPDVSAFLEKYAQPDKPPGNDAPVPPTMEEPYDKGHEAGDEDDGYGNGYDEGEGDPYAPGEDVDVAVGDGQGEGYAQDMGDGDVEGEPDDGYAEGGGNGYEDSPGPIDDMEEDTGNRLGVQAPQVVGSQAIAIDPALLPGVSLAVPAPKSKPRPKMKAPEPEPESVNVPTSTLRVDIPPFNIPSRELPQPHPDHGREPAISNSGSSSETETVSVVVPIQAPSQLVHMPPDGPQCPPPAIIPPPIVQQPQDTAPLNLARSTRDESIRGRGSATGGRGGTRGGRGVGAGGRGGTRGQATGRGGKGGRGAGGRVVESEVNISVTGVSDSQPEAPPKRPRGRPPKDKSK